MALLIRWLPARVALKEWMPVLASPSQPRSGLAKSLPEWGEVELRTVIYCHFNSSAGKHLTICSPPVERSRAHPIIDQKGKLQARCKSTRSLF
jgi:hypothetical protein